MPRISVGGGLVDRRELRGGRPLEIEALEVDEPRQLPDRIVVVVDPQVDIAVVPAAVAAAGAHDEQGRRLATTPIAAGRVGRREARDEQLRERPAAGEERVGEAVDDRRRRPGCCPAPRNQSPVRPPAQAKHCGAGVGRGAPAGVDDADLAVVALVVGRPRSRRSASLGG